MLIAVLSDLTALGRMGTRPSQRTNAFAFTESTFSVVSHLTQGRAVGGPAVLIGSHSRLRDLFALVSSGFCLDQLQGQIEHRFVSLSMPWLNFIASAARLAYQRSNTDLEYVHPPDFFANKSPLFSNRVSSRDFKILRSDSTANL